MQRQICRAVPMVLLGLFFGCMGMSGPAIQGSGVAKTESRQPGEFQAVRIDGMADVSIQIGAPAAVSVTTDDNLLQVITTNVQGNTLVIGSNQSYSTKVGVKVAITVPELSGVQINGSGDIRITGLDAEKFSTVIRGSGNIQAAGTARDLSAQIEGSGDLNLGDLQTHTASISVAGSGNATVNASEQLSASVAGSGNIQYRGAPKNVQKSVAGSGSVRPIG